jgi:hypothetical protein
VDQGGGCQAGVDGSVGNAEVLVGADPVGGGVDEVAEECPPNGLQVGVQGCGVDHGAQQGRPADVGVGGRIEHRGDVARRVVALQPDPEVVGDLGGEPAQQGGDDVVAGGEVFVERLPGDWDRFHQGADGHVPQPLVDQALVAQNLSGTGW